MPFRPNRGTKDYLLRDVCGDRIPKTFLEVADESVGCFVLIGQRMWFSAHDARKKVQKCRALCRRIIVEVDQFGYEIFSSMRSHLPGIEFDSSVQCIQQVFLPIEVSGLNNDPCGSYSAQETIALIPLADSDRRACTSAASRSSALAISAAATYCSRMVILASTTVL